MQHYACNRGSPYCLINSDPKTTNAHARVGTLQKIQKFRSCAPPYVQGTAPPDLIGKPQAGEQGVQVAGTLLVSYQEMSTSSGTLGDG